MSIKVFNIKPLYVFGILISLNTSLLIAQADSLKYNFGDFGGIIYLDSLVVTASKTGFNVSDFIQQVREDKSFFEAFDNIRGLSYQSDNEISMFDKKGKRKAYYFAQIQQYSDGKCRKMNYLKEEIKGNYFKRKRKHKYYTGRMHSTLFLTDGIVCEPSIAEKNAIKRKGIQKHIHELEKLIFQPGSEAKVPLIGKKTAIFSERMQKYYDFSIESGTYKSTIDCYIFSVKVKPEYLDKKKDKTVIKSLRTYFSKSDLQIVARDYYLFYYGSLFDFDVSMKVKLKKYQNLYVPESISYDGFWDIPARKPEKSKFMLTFYNYAPSQNID